MLIKRCFYQTILLCSLIPFALSAQHTKEAKTFAFLQEMFKHKEQKLYNFLIEELTQYSNCYYESQNAPEVYYMLGNMYEIAGKNHLAIAVYLKMVCLYPQAIKNPKYTAAVRRFLSSEKSYKAYKTELLSLLDNPIAYNSIAERYFVYLGVLKNLDQRALYDWMLSAFHNFDQFFPEYAHLSEPILSWAGELYERMRRYKEADACYQKFVRLYPASTLLPSVLYRQGFIHYKGLNDHTGAIKLLKQIASKYKGTRNAVEALLLMGEIKVKRYKNSQSAVKTYQELVDSYPALPEAGDALLEIARLYRHRLNNNAKALKTYEQVLESYSQYQEQTLQAVEALLKLHKSHYKNYLKAVQIYARAAELYPDYSKSPEYLFQAGLLCEKKLKNYLEAASFFKLLLTRYPKSREAERADSRLRNYVAQRRLKVSDYPGNRR